MRYAIAVTAFLVLTSLGASAETQKKDVDIKAADGVNLKGTYFSPGHPGPGILLLHQCNMDRHAWDSLAGDLAGAGFHVLTVDFRGFGDSGGKTKDWREAMRLNAPADVDAMFTYLLAQKGVDKLRLAAGGASCGVPQSTNLAARHHEIKVLVELSGILSSDETKSYIAQTLGLAIFGAASEGDTDPAKGIKTLLALSKNPQSQLRIFPGTEHGVAMFPKDSDLEPMIVSWLKVQLIARGATN
jgi:dienelactone hydrolase